MRTTKGDRGILRSSSIWLLPMKFFPLSKALLRGIACAAVGATLLTSACSPIEKLNGYVPNEGQISQIKPGKQTEADVLRLLGSPSSVATFESRRKIWYYIGSRTETLAFFKPEIVDQHVVSIEFDRAGRVQSVKRYTQEDARKVELVERQTPTRGKELGLLEQLFGNFGRFKSESK